MKKILLGILALVLIVSAIVLPLVFSNCAGDGTNKDTPTTPPAQTTPPTQTVHEVFTLNQAGDTITGLTAGGRKLSELVIPDSINGVNITAIGGSAFYFESSLKSVVIGNNVKTIGTFAFSSCEALEEIVLPNGIERIENLAFYSSDNLKYNEKDGLKYLGSSESKHLYLAGTSNEEMTEVSIDASCRIIGEEAFMNCSALTQVYIPASVRQVSTSTVFRNCKSLTKIEVAKENEFYKAIDGNLYSKDGKTFVCYANKNPNTVLVLPDGVEVIEENACYFCSDLQKIVLPESLKAIGSWALCGTSIKEITIGAGVESIGKDIFGSFSALKSINISEDNAHYKSADSVIYTKDGKTLIRYAPGKTETAFDIPYGVETIEESAFASARNLTSVKIPDSVKTIGYSAFDLCTELKDIVIPDSVEKIEDSAFGLCYKIKSILIPDGITEIESFLFSYCTGLENVVIPRSVKLIDSYAFSHCESLQEITFLGTVAEWEAMKIYDSYKNDSPLSVVHCIDGDVQL